MSNRENLRVTMNGISQILPTECLSDVEEKEGEIAEAFENMLKKFFPEASPSVEVTSDPWEKFSGNSHPQIVFGNHGDRSVGIYSADYVFHLDGTEYKNFSEEKRNEFLSEFREAASLFVEIEYFFTEEQPKKEPEDDFSPF